MKDWTIVLKGTSHAVAFGRIGLSTAVLVLVIESGTVTFGRCGREDEW
jgi:hypothetical protein